VIDQTIAKFEKQLQDPKAALVHWLTRLEQMPGGTFKIPTALKLTLDRLPAEAFEVKVPRLVCVSQGRSTLPDAYLEQLGQKQLDYMAINDEARRRLAVHGPADALRALSSLIENNPGDTVLARDVAFSAMKWNLGGQAYPLLRRVAKARPYQPQSYQAMGQCLSQTGNGDLAMIFYEVALAGNWNNAGSDFKKIVSAEYLHLLRRIDAGRIECRASDYAEARLASLTDKSPLRGAGLVVTMMWNTDRTDVDLHVVEPNGEVCYYSHPKTKSGGTITDDVTNGFGPEMYVLPKTLDGKYAIKVNYFGSDANRTTTRTKVYMTVYENFGTANEKITTRTVDLGHSKQMRHVMTVKVGQ